MPKKPSKHFTKHASVEISKKGNKVTVDHSQPVSDTAKYSKEKEREAPPQPPKSFARRKITSNWDKYDKEIDVDTEEPIQDPYDFNHLLKNSNTDGYHFQLESEKNWVAQGNEQKPTGNIFCLDLKLLSSGLSSLPFYERIGLDKSKLLPESIEKYDRDSKRNYEKYQSETKCVPDLSLEKKAENLKSKIEKLSVYDEISSTSDRIDPIMGSEPTSMKDCSLPKKFLDDDDEEDLEGWLDSVLDK